MKRNEIVLNSKIEDLESTLEELENGNEKFLSILGNLFLIKNINTCLHVKTINSWLNQKSIFFKFSYNDENFKNIISIKYNFEDDSVFAFLNESNLIDKDHLNSIFEKAVKTIKQSRHMNVDEAENTISDIIYNEALILLTTSINKEDIENVKSDFEAKYENWKKIKNDINNNGVKFINSIYNKLIKIKLNEHL